MKHIRLYPLRFRDPQIESEWMAFSAVSWRRFALNDTVAIAYIMFVAFNWLVSQPDISAVCCLVLQVGLTKIYTQSPNFRVWMSHIGLVGILVSLAWQTVRTSTYVNTPATAGIIINPHHVAIVFSMASTYQGRSSSIHLTMGLFVLLSPLIWYFTNPNVFSNIHGFSVLLTYCKVALTGMLAAYAEDLNRRVSFYTAKEIIKMKDELSPPPAAILNEIPFYLADRNIDTREYILPIGDMACIQNQSWKQRLWVYWRTFVMMRFMDDTLEMEYRRIMTKRSVYLYVTTTVINVVGAITTNLLSSWTLIQQGTATSITFLIYFPVALIAPKLFLLSSKMRRDPWVWQAVILTSAVFNIGGWVLNHFLFINSQVIDDATFFLSINCVVIATFAAGSQSGLLAICYYPILIVVVIFHVFTGIFIATNTIYSYFDVTAIPATCAAAAIICVTSEFESRKLYLLAKWSEELNLARSPEGGFKSPNAQLMATIFRSKHQKAKSNTLKAQKSGTIAFLRLARLLASQASCFSGSADEPSCLAFPRSTSDFG
ncbi:uncharacterized protein BJ171DRAFT_570305, partial [Polychytrium aggregatum]|uniref:uncharacterized protein n=1 Tax=Polychytrium aggregatum TaxID=110093 RepID=UPI0022FDCA90